MAINSIFQSGLQGIKVGMARLDKTAANINNHTLNRGSDNLTGLSEELVELKIVQNNINAAVNVVETTDDLLGRLVDIHI